MKVVHVGLDLVPSSGGSVVSIRDFSRVTNSDVISFTQTAKLKKEVSFIQDTIHIETSSGFLGRHFAWAPEYNRRVAMEAISNADLIVCHILLRYHVHWVSAIAKQRNIPYCVVPHGCLDPYVFSYRSFVKKVWFYLFGRPFLKNAASVIYATEKEKLKSDRYYDGNNTRVIYWPVEGLDLSRRDHARETIRRKHSIASDDKVLIYLGRLHSSKRPVQTITSFAQANVFKTHLLLVGPEETITKQECLGLAEKLGVANVHLVGPVYGKEKDDYLLASDAYISLSLKENFGYTTAEALSAGLPVILSPGNDLADELISLDCGWMLKDNQLETAASAISEFSALSTVQLQKMGMRGRSWALANLEFEKFAEQVRKAATDSIEQFKNAEM